jgi:predicted O-methyltransferase YrrM
LAPTCDCGQCQCKTASSSKHMMIIAAIIATYTSLQLLLLQTTPVSARALGDGVEVGTKSNVDDIYRYISPVPVMSGRDLMPLLVNISGFKSIAEVGVQAGVFSELLLQMSGPQIQSYILVDIWAEQKHYDDGANVNNTLQQKLYEQTLERVAPYKEKSRVMRMYSLQAAAVLQKELEQSKRTVPSAQSHAPLTEQLDLVYLDARHDYCGCLEDIVAWWPLLKENGILCGHDFMWKNPEWHMCANGSVIPGGVRAAVMDWARDNDLQVLFVVLDHSSFRGV